MGRIAQPRQQGPPVADAVPSDPHQGNVRGRADEPLLQIAPHTIRDRQRDDQRSYARCNPNHGDRRDHSNDGLAPLRTQVTRPL